MVPGMVTNLRCILAKQALTPPQQQHKRFCMPTLLPQNSAFIVKSKHLLINSRWQNAGSGKTFPTSNPAGPELGATVLEHYTQSRAITLRIALSDQ
jgi:hypothetical protein